VSKLQLLLLGHFECLLPSGERILLSMRKAEVLLAYLALAPGIRHPRERLINLLWSDRGEEQARNSLRQCLSAIKKSLGDVADLVIQVDRTTVCLKPEMIDIDALEFERLATIAEFESLSDAAALYRGEFLEGISIRDAASQEWLDSERSRFKRQHIEILINLGHTLLASHDHSGATRTAERLVAEDALGESGWRLLMRAYSENGDRSHALQAFKRCQQALRSELDVEPESATLELREQIAASQVQPTQAPVRDIASAANETEAAPTASSRETPVGTSQTGGHRIAVLPFDNLSGDPEQEYFSDGITDSVILNLSLFAELQVKSRYSSFAFKQQIKSLGEISTELNVDYLVEGSIRKSADRIRITVQLIEAVNGNQVWGKRYDADLENLFDLEEELSRNIAATVTGQIETDLQRIAMAKGAAGQQSYDLLLSGIFHSYRFNRRDTVIAIEKLNQCLEQDPDNVRAHVYLYICHAMDYLGRWTVDYQASFDLAKSYIDRALQLNPELGLVQTFYAEYLSFSGNPAEAIRHLDKALEINPNDTDALAIRANCLALQGDFEASLRVAEQVCRMDPYHPWAEWELAGGQYNSGDYATTLETIARHRTDPGFTRIFAIASHVKLGHIEAAREALQDFLQACREDMLSMPQGYDDWLIYLHDTYPYDDLRYSRDLADCMAQAGLEEFLGGTAQPVPNTSHSIAVLPFDNLSGDPAQEYFSDGISESIILHLNLFPGLNVKSRNSSFAFKQQIKGLGEISEELGVDYLVEGSLRKSTDQIRITVQLVEAASGNQVWGKRYDAPLADLFNLEEELSRSIAATVTGQIESDLQRVALAKSASDQQAYDLLLCGIYHNQRYTREDTVIAIDKLTQCLQKDPDNVMAHVWLYVSHLMDYLDRWSRDHLDSFELGAQHIGRAKRLAPENTQVQIFFAQYLVFCGDFDEAKKQLDKLVSNNPDNPTVLTTMALNLGLQGKAEDALRFAERACELDPYHPWAEWEVVGSQYISGQYEDALQTIVKLRTTPGFIQIFGIAANVKLGRESEAQRALQSFLNECRETMHSVPRTTDEWLAYTRENYPFDDPQVNQGIIDCLVQAGLTDEITEAHGDTPSIAVLPFANLSDDPEQEYFSDGITASLILGLGLFKGLNVKSRGSSFAFRNSEKSSKEIARELAADFLIEGSIRKSGNKVRLAVQLVESETDTQVWGKQYDAELVDILDLEQELSATIAATISGRIGHRLQQSAVRKPAASLKSYDYLLRGLYHMGKLTAADMKIAQQQIEKCIELEPDNAEAHMQLGMIHSVNFYENWSQSREQSLEISGVHLTKALELAPDNALVQAYYGEYLYTRRDYDRALFHVDKAIELNPTAAEGYTMKADILAATRRYDEALECADRCFQLDPNAVGTGWVAGDVYRITGHYEKSIKTLRSISHPPITIHASIAASLVGLGDIEQARSEMGVFHDRAREQMSQVPETRAAWRQFWKETSSYKYEADFEDLFSMLMQAGLCDESDRAPPASRPGS